MCGAVVVLQDFKEPSNLARRTHSYRYSLLSCRDQAKPKRDSEKAMLGARQGEGLWALFGVQKYPLAPFAKAPLANETVPTLKTSALCRGKSDTTLNHLGKHERHCRPHCAQNCATAMMISWNRAAACVAHFVLAADSLVAQHVELGNRSACAPSDVYMHRMPRSRLQFRADCPATHEKQRPDENQQKKEPTKPRPTNVERSEPTVGRPAASQ